MNRSRALCWLAGAALASAAAAAAAQTDAPQPQNARAFSPPDVIPPGPFGDAVRYGEQVFEHTQAATPQDVGNGLTCENCHVDRGRRAGSAPMWAAFISYPQYRAKNGKVDTLEERIQDCFRFSMNGRPPAAASKEMVGLVSYFSWLATGAPVGAKLAGAGYPRLPQPRLPADPDRGAAVYQAHCALCHGAGGAGQKAAGVYVFPPLWGPDSFNWGAGMATVATAAGFIEANMPWSLGGTLPQQQAWDLAAFVDSRPRPQDPRFNGDIEATRRTYHASGDYYGQTVDGVLLGAP